MFRSSSRSGLVFYLSFLLACGCSNLSNNKEDAFVLEGPAESKQMNAEASILVKNMTVEDLSHLIGRALGGISRHATNHDGICLECERREILMESAFQALALLHSPDASHVLVNCLAFGKLDAGPHLLLCRAIVVAGKTAIPFLEESGNSRAANLIDYIKRGVSHP